MIATPCDQGGILIRRVLNVVRKARAFCIADTFGVPSQTHRLCAIPFGGREGRDATGFDFVLNGFGFQRAHLIRPKKGLVEMGVLDAQVNSFAGSRGGRLSTAVSNGRGSQTADGQPCRHITKGRGGLPQRGCFGVQPKERPQVVAADECFCQVWFPLTLFLNIINDFMRVRGADITQVAVYLAKVTCQLEG
jgi:hypothetical protein